MFESSFRMLAFGGCFCFFMTADLCIMQVNIMPRNTCFELFLIPVDFFCFTGLF